MGFRFHMLPRLQQTIWKIILQQEKMIYRNRMKSNRIVLISPIMKNWYLKINLLNTDISNIISRNIVNAWTGLNDLTKELHFRWADYSISNFQPFCHNPTKDTNKDCVKMASKSHPGKSNGKDTSGHDTEYGCLKPEACGLGHPYVCQIKNPNCKPSTNRYKEYLTTLLSEAAQVNKVCGGSCKAGSKGGKGVSSYFKKERRQKKKIGEGRVPKNGNKKNGKKTKVTKKTTKGKKRKTSISTFFL